MWHLKTKFGTFWIVESDKKKTQKYYLGCEDEDLGAYESLHRILDDVQNQETGLLQWDEQEQINAPQAIEEWVEGPPAGW